MKSSIFLGLILVLSCSDNGDASQGTDISQGTGTSQVSDTAQVTETAGEASASGPTDSSVAASDPAGSGSASQSGGSTTQSSDASGSGGTSGSTGTGSCMAQDGPSPVELGDADDLGAAGAYVVLAKSAVSNVPGTSISGGHVGVSPVAHTALTGFALVLDKSGQFATSPAVVAPARVYAADYGVPTPSNLTTAVLAMQTAYADAAGRIPTDFLNLGSGDIGGSVLPPGIYTWGSTVTIAEDITLAGCADDVWILQISGDLDVSTSKRVLLGGEAQAKNVFWQVAGQATIHVDAHLEGVILAKTGVTFQTKASLHGRAYAQTMIAFDKTKVTAP